MRTVKEISDLTGISVRTLHYYDEIGLLKPTEKSDAGYRLYDDKALETLQQILFFREFDISLNLDAVKDVGKFLIEIMPVMFIPAGVGLMSSWGTLKPLLLPVSIITVVTIVTVMAATGKVSQWVIRKGKSDKEENEKDE